MAEYRPVVGDVVSDKGTEKIIYESGTRPDERVVGVFREQEPSSRLRARYYFTKLLREFFPDQIVDVKLASFLHQTIEAERIHGDEPDDSPTNKELIDQFKSAARAKGFEIDQARSNFIVRNGKPVFVDIDKPWDEGDTVGWNKYYDPWLISAAIADLPPERQARAKHYLSRLVALYNESRVD